MTMVHYAVLDASDNTIKTGIAQESTVGYLAGLGERVVITERIVDPVTELVVPPPSGSPPTTPGTITPRPTAGMTVNKTALAANGTDYVRISNVPAGATALVTVPEGAGIAAISPVTVNDGLFDVTTTVAGTYRVTIQNFPNQDFVVTLNAS